MTEIVRTEAQADRLKRRAVLAGIGILLALAGCAPRTGQTSTPSREPAGPSEGVVVAPPLVSPACEALAERQHDAFRRWIAVYPLPRGGIILVFTGQEAQPQAVTATLTSLGLMGYELVTCGTSVVAWVPAYECPDSMGLAARIEESTTMTLLESHCFSVDEVQHRLRADCEQGVFPVEYCDEAGPQEDQ